MVVRAIASCFSLLLLMALAVAASAAKDDLVLVSRASGAGTAGGTDNSGDPSVSADGRYIAFESNADNFSVADNNALSNIFMRDVVGNSTILVNRATGATGAAADDQSGAPSISADGRFVAFVSYATNLSAADGPDQDVFIRNVQTDVTALISRTNDPDSPTANGTSYAPSISADGRFVAFGSDADNLNEADDNSVTNIFVRDRGGGTTTLVSRADGTGDPGASGDSLRPSISADGSLVAFESDADNLSGADNNSVQNIFVRNLDAGTTTLVSRGSGAAGPATEGDSENPSISANGRFVAFECRCNNLHPDTPSSTAVLVRDLVAHTTTLVSRADGASGAAPDRVAAQPTISADGANVVFSSNATNFSGADNDDLLVFDIFVRNTIANTTTLVSRASGPEGPGGDGSSLEPSISADGRYVAFVSVAANFNDLDFDGIYDVFVRDVLGPPVSGGGGGGSGAGAGGGAGAQVSDRTSPSLSGLSFSPRAFAPLGGRRSSIVSRRAPRGARVGYRLSEAARVSFRVERQLRGRRRGRRCVVTKRKRGRRCTTYKRLRGSFSHSGALGRNGFRFSGHLAGRRLKPGSYRLVGEPKDPAGNRGRSVRASFRIVKATGARARRR